MQSGSRRSWRLAAPFFILVLGAGLAGCGDGKDKEAARAPETIRAMETQVVRKELVEPVTGTGTVTADKTTVLGPRVTGIIDKVFVKVGDKVKEGDPLFQTREIEFRLKVAELESQVKLAQANLRNASRAFNRSEELHTNGFVSNGGLDNARAAKDTAAAQLGIAQAQLAAVKQQLTDSVVRAPFDGVITRRDVDEGKYMTTMGVDVSMGTGASSGSGVVQVMKIDVVSAIVQIPETDLRRVGVGTKAKVIVDGIGRSFDTEAAIVNDSVNAESRAVEIRLPIRNPDYAVKPGMFVRAEFYPAPRNALVLDRGAVQGTESQHYVFVSENGIARRVPVTLRQIDASTVEVLSGLKEGQQALTGPNLALIADGTPIRIETVAANLP